jgi:hypothetical protein
VTLSVNDTQHNNSLPLCLVHFASVAFYLLLCCVVMLNVVMLNVVMLNVIMLNAIMLSVTAPK